MSTPEGQFDELETDADEVTVLALQRSPRISQADIFQAADALLIEGVRPSIDRVRMRIGRGSPNTIQHHMDLWWKKLGSRLRDLPDKAFPQVPERVGHALQLLWNEALEGAHETLRSSMQEREEAMTQQELALGARARTLAEREQMTATRTAAIEESLVLVREQLSAANQRAETLESALRSRDAECVRLHERITTLEALAAQSRQKLDAATASHQAERARQEERHATTEARWLTEVDRARQLNKETTKEHERQVKELRDRVHSLQKDCDQHRQELADTRSDLKTAIAVRDQLEARVRAISALPAVDSSTRARPGKRPEARKRAVKRPASRF